MSFDVVLNQKSGVGVSLALADFAVEKAGVAPLPVRAVTVMVTVGAAALCGVIYNLFILVTTASDYFQDSQETGKAEEIAKKSEKIIAKLKETACLLAIDSAALMAPFIIKLVLCIGNAYDPATVRRHYEKITDYTPPVRSVRRPATARDRAAPAA